MSTKIHILVLLTLLLCSEVSFSQEISKDADKKPATRVTESYLSIFLSLGTTNLNYGKLNSTFSDHKSSIIGKQIGVSFNAGIAPQYSLVSELYFITKGGKLKATNPLTNIEITTQVYSFELPVLARFHFGNFHVNAGPSIAYNFYGTQKVDNIKATIAFNNSIKGFNRWEAGAQLGGGYTFQSRKERKMFLGVRYHYGLSDLSNGQEIYSRSLVISLYFSKPWIVTKEKV